MFYDKGIKVACMQLGLEKYALNLGQLVKQLRYSYQASPVARAELQRMMGGAGVGALTGGIGGGVAGSAMGKDVPVEEGSLHSLLGGETETKETGGHPVSGALLGTLLGGIGGAFGARSLGRLQEGRIAKALGKRRDIPFSVRSNLKRQASESVIPRMPKLEKAPTAPKTAPAVAPAARGPVMSGGAALPEDVSRYIPKGVTNISPALLERARAAGML